MISISNKNKALYNWRLVTVLGIFFVSCLMVPVAYAQNSFSLAVTPTLFEMSANPGQIWQSSVKVINSNPFDIVVYPSVVNFEPQGEAGQGRLLPVLESMTEGSTLAEWVEISSSPVTVLAEQSKVVPFGVFVPDDASPGGHFAAILISTQPTAEDGSKLSVKTSQVVSSLFFVRVSGDVIEDGTIRSFSVAQSFLQSPAAEFELRFENKGNVHLQPRGEITIYNMWGKERGVIPINYRTHFGNVLPNSIRNFRFSWEGESSFTDIGRYKADVSLAYGAGSTQFVSSATYFWVVPLKALFFTLAGLFGAIFIIVVGIRTYVRHMLFMAGVNPERRTMQKVSAGDIEVSKYKTITAPVRNGFDDLKNRLQNVHALWDVVRVLVTFLKQYRLFFGFIACIIVIIVISGFFIADVTDENKNYDVSIDNPDSTTSLNAEEIVFDSLSNGVSLSSDSTTSDQRFTLSVVNTSGKSGTAAYAAYSLTESGYAVSELRADTSRVNKNTVIVFDASVPQEALKISRKFGGALLSARTATTSDEVASTTTKVPNITVFVGQNQIVR